MGGYAPRALDESVRPRRSIGRKQPDSRASFDLSAARTSGRPLNFTVRRRNDSTPRLQIIARLGHLS